MMNRRKLLYNLASFSAAKLTGQSLLSLKPNGSGETEHGNDESFKGNQKHSPHKPLHIGVIGAGGVGVYFLNRVAEQLDCRCTTIAIEFTANRNRLQWCDPQSRLLIGDRDETPATVTDAQQRGRDQRSDIVQLISGLNAAFLLTGLNGISGKGIALAVAETLRESGLFTVAVVLGRREPDAVNSLRQLVDAAIEIPYPWQVARGARNSPWRKQFAAEIALACRVTSKYVHACM